MEGYVVYVRFDNGEEGYLVGYSRLRIHYNSDPMKAALYRREYDAERDCQYIMEEFDCVEDACPEDVRIFL